MNKLDIKSETMLGTHHSWAVVMRNLLLQFRGEGHNLYLKSINGTSFLQDKLKYRIGKRIVRPDINICYTMPRNFKDRFSSDSKLKLAIYNYETSKLPREWADKIKYIDYALPSSNFSKEIFVEAGWPEERCIVIPHGINPEDHLTDEKFKLYNDKTFRFLNVSIPHYRKNIDILMNAYYSAFSDEDDVCLVLKTKLDPPGRKLHRFEVDVRSQIVEAQKKHLGKIGGLPKVEIVLDRLPSMIPLYNSCDVLINAASSEGFGMPLLEGLASGNLIIAPRCSGQLDFLNDNNSLLVDVKEIPAGSKYQYWNQTDGAKTYLPIVDSLSQAMLDAYKDKALLMDKFESERQKTLKEFTWKNAAKKILNIKRECIG